MGSMKNSNVGLCCMLLHEPTINFIINSGLFNNSVVLLFSPELMFFDTRDTMPVNLHNLTAQQSGSDKMSE